jgi:choline dehydrogenase-like flavoprotein
VDLVTVLVVGSGAGAVQASLELLEQGLRVRMIDVGKRPAPDDVIPPARSFKELRFSDPDQHAYFLGRDLGGIPFQDIRTGNKLPPLRKYVIASEDEKPPCETGNFVLNQSLARGGLAMSWGAGAMPLREADFEALPFGLEDLAPYYEKVCRTIGISGDRDDLAERLRAPDSMQSPLALDSPSERLLAGYHRVGRRMRERGLTMGRAWLAVNTEESPGRGVCAYDDMEFWGDADRAVYRPEWTLRELERSAAFEYLGGLEALRLDEPGRGVRLEVRDTATNAHSSLEADAVVLAASIPGSARIALRSLERFGAEHAVPICTNAYSYVPCLFLPMVGRPVREERCSLAQLSMLFEPDDDLRHTIYSSVFTYRSMLTFKLLKEAPIPYRFGLDVFRMLLPAMMIVTVFHADDPSSSKRYWVEKDEGGGGIRDRIRYDEDAATVRQQERTERALFARLRPLGLLPIKRIRRAPGSAIHYAGSLPLSARYTELTCTSEGRLRPFRRVWVADASALPMMPAVPPTFTIMANARRAAHYLAGELRAEAGSPS